MLIWKFKGKKGSEGMTDMWSQNPEMLMVRDLEI